MATGGNLRFWVDMTLECIRRDHTGTLSAGDQRGPFLTARALGMALAALHDANAIAGTGTPLLAVPVPAGLAGGNPIVAGAAACHQMLTRRYPKQAAMLQDAWLLWTALDPTAGTSVVEAAARAFADGMHALGAQDAAHAAFDAYQERAEAYRHIKPAAEPAQGYAGGIWGEANPLMTSRPHLDPPPGRVAPTTVDTSAHFLADFDKVAEKGIAVPNPLSPTRRTAEEEVIGIFWGYDGPPELGTPPRLYMQVALGILDTVEATKPGALNLGEELRILAGLGIAMADAGIHAWFYKYSPLHMMWRPTVGIPGAVGGNGTPIPGWLPLGRPDTNNKQLSLTPNFPAYPSGHATFGAAAFQLLRLALVEKKLAAFAPDGTDDIAFSFTSDEYDGRNTDPRSMLPRPRIARRHDSLWQAIVENSVSRVYLGVHWEFDGITKKAHGTSAIFGVPASPAELGRIGGVWLGAKIANAIAPALGIRPHTIAASKMA